MCTRFARHVLTLTSSWCPVLAEPSRRRQSHLLSGRQLGEAQGEYCSGSPTGSPLLASPGASLPNLSSRQVALMGIFRKGGVGRNCSRQRKGKEIPLCVHQEAFGVGRYLHFPFVPILLRIKMKVNWKLPSSAAKLHSCRASFRIDKWRVWTFNMFYPGWFSFFIYSFIFFNLKEHALITC